MGLPVSPCVRHHAPPNTRLGIVISKCIIGVGVDACGIIGTRAHKYTYPCACLVVSKWAHTTPGSTQVSQIISECVPWVGTRAQSSATVVKIIAPPCCAIGWVTPTHLCQVVSEVSLRTLFQASPCLIVRSVECVHQCLWSCRVGYTRTHTWSVVVPSPKPIAGWTHTHT